jgi:hypothetical protein
MPSLYHKNKDWAFLLVVYKNYGVMDKREAETE